MEKQLLSSLIVLTLSACSTLPNTSVQDNFLKDCYPFLELGIGYKLDELVFYDQGKRVDHKVSGSVDVGEQCGAFSAGLSHHSQPFVGAPFGSSNDVEYRKTEIYVRYRLKL